MNSRNFLSLNAFSEAIITAITAKNPISGETLADVVEESGIFSRIDIASIKAKTPIVKCETTININGEQKNVKTFIRGRVNELQTTTFTDEEDSGKQKVRLTWTIDFAHIGLTDWTVIPTNAVICNHVQA